MTSQNIPEPMYPPPYTVRKSSRAKRILLRISPGKGLEVVLPPYAGEKDIPDVLASMRPWVEKHMKRMQTFLRGNGRHGSAADSQHDGQEEKGHGTGGEPHAGLYALPRLPLSLSLFGGKSSVMFCYRHGYMPGIAGAEDNGRVILLPETRTPENARHLPDGGEALTPEGFLWLRERLRREAEELLLPRLVGYGRDYGFHFRAARFRFQKTRWGSCSSKGNINLNVGLVFLPEPLVRYVLLHELCHTIALNHSEKFWQALFRVEPDALALDRQLRKAQHYLPYWLYMA